MNNTTSKTLLITGLLSTVLLAGCGNTTTTTVESTWTIDTWTTNTGIAKTQKVLTSEKVAYKTPDSDWAESIKVTLTTENDKIVDFVIDAEGQNPISQKWQNAFKEGIAAQIIGKSVDGLNVGVVNGASLTSTAFNDAVSKLQG